MLASLICAAVLCAAPNDAELIENLKANWESQRSAMTATAHFRARVFLSGDLDPLSGEEVDAVFDSVNLVERPDDLRKVVAAIWKYKELPPVPWSHLEVWIDGSRLREREVDRLGAMDNLVDQGITVVQNDAARQTSILRTSDSRWKHRNVDDFRFLPSLAFTARVASRESGRVHITDPEEPAEELEVDEATGFAYSWRLYEKGSLTQEILQFGPVSHPGDMVLPTATVRMRFRDNALSYTEILVVEQAEVNINLPPDTFVAKASKGTLIDDARRPQREEAWHAKSDIDDVVKAFPLVADPTPSAHADFTTLAIVIGALVAALLLFFYRRPKLER